MSIAVWVMGVDGVYGFVCHLFFAPFVAEQSGWPNSSFLFEVAYANLTIGMLGLSSVWLRRRDDLLAAMVANCSWFFADGVRHLVPLVVDANNALSNVGSVLYTNLLVPELVVLLLWISRRQCSRMQG